MVSPPPMARARNTRLAEARPITMCPPAAGPSVPGSLGLGRRPRMAIDMAIGLKTPGKPADHTTRREAIGGC